MDARIYFYLTDAVAEAETVDELAVIGELIRAAQMSPFERRALDRALQARAAQLRSGAVASPRAAGGD